MNRLSQTTRQNQHAPRQTLGRHGRLALVAALTLHAALLAWGAIRHSPSTTEMSSMAAGVYHWHHARFDVYQVNPPLIRMLATWPVVLAQPETDWNVSQSGMNVRPEYSLGDKFVRINGSRSIRLFTLARWACIPISLLGACVCFLWARDLYGPSAGLLALCLWCFSPNLLAHGQLITADAGAATFGLLAGYAFWRWLREPSLARMLIAGATLGLAELSKTTWLVLFAIWPLLWLAWALPPNRGIRHTGRQAAQLCVVLLLGLLILNAGYLFDGTFSQLGDFKFVSEAFAGDVDIVTRFAEGGNRFLDGPLASVPLPLPRDYVIGIDLQKLDFEGTHFAYLAGRWQAPGWWYYYLYGCAVKVPLGTLTLAILAVLLTCASARRTAWRDELVLLAPAITVLVLVSSQTRMNEHFRYILPVLPFTIVWISKCASRPAFQSEPIRLAVVAALSATILSSLFTYPHCLSYFNELAGGPRQGYRHLLGSNLDWGQDLLYLKRWCDAHPHAQPIDFQAGSTTLCDVVLTGRRTHADSHRTAVSPRPGWLAISINKLINEDQSNRYLHGLRPADRVAYSIFVYHLTLKDANRARRELGLPELPVELK
jgi:dolichyl-phosphate-mannose-protein mannosyltransferase